MSDQETAMPEAFLTASEVAAFLKLKVDTVYILAQQGKLPGTKVGGQWRFMESHIIRWFETQALSPSKDASRLVLIGPEEKHSG